MLRTRTSRWTTRSPEEEGRKKVVKKEVVMTPHQGTGELFHNSCSQTCCGGVSSTSIHLKVADVAVDAVSPHPDCEATFRWFFGEVLLEGGLPLELHHGFIYTGLTVR